MERLSDRSITKAVLTGSSIGVLGATLILSPELTSLQVGLGCAVSFFSIMAAEELLGMVDKVDSVKRWLTFRGSNRFRLVKPINYGGLNITRIEDYKRDESDFPSA